jgi:D-glycero-D-manno-heptose 1,7-bisphosphate phosphatase
VARAVFLDRDGVINRASVRDGKPYPPEPVSSFELIEGVPEALTRLRAAGFMLIVVTNQPDVARGIAKREDIEMLHRDLLAKLPLDEIVTCYHDGESCACRKPQPGALLEAARRHAVELRHSFMIGDRWRDIEAGQRAGCQCLFIDYGYSERQPNPPFVRVASLAHAAELLTSSAANQRSPTAASEDL